MHESVAWQGLDAHAKFSLLAWLDDQGQRRAHWRFPTSETQLVKHLQLIPTSVKHLALEECGLGRWLAQVARPPVTEANSNSSIKCSTPHWKWNARPAA